MPAPGATREPSAEGPVRIGPYAFLKPLGFGAFGRVKLAVHERTNEQVAIKELNRARIAKQEMTEKVTREMHNLKQMQHPHIIRLYEVISTPTDIFLVMEYVCRGELFEHIVQNGRLSETDARKFFQQIIAGVEYCHMKGVVHRDLKPENLLLDDRYRVKIADFGLSNVLQDGYFLRTSCGSPNYAAPEVISGSAYAGPEVDVWSCGVILYALLVGNLPFDDDNYTALFKKIKAGRYKLPSRLSPEARDLISQLLIVDPMRRITIDRIRDHPWFKESLPAYLAVRWCDTDHSYLAFNKDLAARVVSLGYPSVTSVQTLLEMVRAGVSNPATVAYDLLVHRALDEHTSEKPVEESSKAPRVPLFAHALAKPSTDPTAMFGADPPAQISGALSPSAANNSDGVGGDGYPRVRQRRFRRWYLGIQSKKEPINVMGEVFRALEAGGFAWKVLGPFRIRCKLVSPPQDRDFKLGLQLYKVQPGIYLLDLHKIAGDAFTFMHLCAKIIMELKVPTTSVMPSTRTQMSPVSSSSSLADGMERLGLHGAGSMSGLTSPASGTNSRPPSSAAMRGYA